MNRETLIQNMIGLAMLKAIPEPVVDNILHPLPEVYVPPVIEIPTGTALTKRRFIEPPFPSLMYFFTDTELIAASQEFNIEIRREMDYYGGGLCAPARHGMSGRRVDDGHSMWPEYTPSLRQWFVNTDRLIQISGKGVDHALLSGKPLHMAMCHGNYRFMGDVYPESMSAEFDMGGYKPICLATSPALRISANFVGCGALNIL